MAAASALRGVLSHQGQIRGDERPFLVRHVTGKRLPCHAPTSAPCWRKSTTRPRSCGQSSVCTSLGFSSRRSRMRRRHELTDEEWGAVERRLPGRDGDPGCSSTRCCPSPRPASRAAARPNGPAGGTASGVAPTAGPRRASGPTSPRRWAGRTRPDRTWARRPSRRGTPRRARAGCPGEKRGGRRPAVPRTLARRVGGQAAPRGGGRHRACRATGPKPGPGRRRAAGGRRACWTGCGPGTWSADAACDSDAIRGQLRRAKARARIRPNPTRKRKMRYAPPAVPEPQRDRAILRRDRAVPTRGDAVRKEGGELPRLRVVRRRPREPRMNVHTT